MEKKKSLSQRESVPEEGFSLQHLGDLCPKDSIPHGNGTKSLSPSSPVATLQ